MPPVVQNAPKTWPSPQDWQAAIQNPHIAFTVAFLKNATPAVDHLGLPTVWSGKEETWRRRRYRNFWQRRDRMPEG